LTNSELEKWLRLEGYEDSSRIELTDPDPAWFDAVNALMRLPSSETNRLYLTWEIVQLSRINTFHSLHTLHYNDAAFMGLLNDAFQKYSNSLEFQISFAFAGIARGQYYNGIRQLQKLCEGDRTPTPYKSVLLRAIEMWLDMSNSFLLSNLNPHDHRFRAVTFNCTIPAHWLGKREFVDQFEDDSLTLLSLQPNNQRPLNYGSFQGLPGFSSADVFLDPHIRLDFMARLVSDYWGFLGKIVISAFRCILQKVIMTREYAVVQMIDESKSSMKVYLAASVTNISLVGYTSLAEWNAIVSCLRWLVALVGAPGGHLSIRHCSPGQWKLKPIWRDLRNRLPEDIRDTVIEMQYIVTEEQMTGLYTLSTMPCWLNMFSGAYIGAHVCQNFTYSNVFEETTRWTGKGLKLEFDILIQAAGVEEIIEVDGSPILCGFQSALIPIAQYEDDSIQWHLVTTKDDEGPMRWIQHRDDFRALLPVERMKHVEIDKLKGTAYVGWHRTGVNVILGTLDPPSEVLRSKLPLCQHIRIPSDFQVQVGIQTTISPVGAVVGITKTYRRCSLAFAIAPPDNFFAIVDQLFSKHVIVYDEGAKVALFCPLINLVLFLIRAYLRNNCYPSNVLDLRFAPSLQHHQSAIRDLGDKSIVPGFTFRDVVKVVTHRYSAVYQFLPAELRLTGGDILGFEVTDILGNNDTVYARKLPIKKGVKPWSLLAKTTDVAFTGGIGQIISIDEGKAPVPRCSLKIPSGRDILVFPIPLLKRHFDGAEGQCFRQRGRGEFQWEPTPMLFDCKSGNECDGESCWKSRLQCIKKGSGVLKRKKSNGTITQEVKWMSGDGAVCFGYISGK